MSTFGDKAGVSGGEGGRREAAMVTSHSILLGAGERVSSGDSLVGPRQHTHEVNPTQANTSAPVNTA